MVAVSRAKIAVPARFVCQDLSCFLPPLRLLQQHLTGSHAQDIEGLGVSVALFDDSAAGCNFQRGHAVKDGLLGGLQHVLEQQIVLCGTVCMSAGV